MIFWTFYDGNGLRFLTTRYVTIRYITLRHVTTRIDTLRYVYLLLERNLLYFRHISLNKLDIPLSPAQFRNVQIDMHLRQMTCFTWLYVHKTNDLLHLTVCSYVLWRTWSYIHCLWCTHKCLLANENIFQFAISRN